MKRLQVNQRQRMTAAKKKAFPGSAKTGDKRNPSVGRGQRKDEQERDERARRAKFASESLKAWADRAAAVDKRKPKRS